MVLALKELRICLQFKLILTKVYYLKQQTLQGLQKLFHSVVDSFSTKIITTFEIKDFKLNIEDSQTITLIERSIQDTKSTIIKPIKCSI